PNRIDDTEKQQGQSDPARVYAGVECNDRHKAGRRNQRNGNRQFQAVRRSEIESKENEDSTKRIVRGRHALLEYRRQKHGGNISLNESDARVKGSRARLARQQRERKAGKGDREAAEKEKGGKDPG